MQMDFLYNSRFPRPDCLFWYLLAVGREKEPSGDSNVSWGKSGVMFHQMQSDTAWRNTRQWAAGMDI